MVASMRQLPTGRWRSMGTIECTLQQISGHLEESMGLRNGEPQTKLTPVPQHKDVGRRPLRTVGKVDVGMVIPDPYQPRTDFSEEAIERLAASIRDKGQLSAIRVRWSDDHQKWVIIAGERRWRATKHAGLPTIDCYFQEDELSKSEVLEQQLIENCLREDLRPIEEAKAFATLMEFNEWNGKQLAEALRLPPAKVSRTLALLKLPDDIQDQVNSGQLAARAAYEISKLEDDQKRRELAHKAAAGILTLDQAASAVRQRKGKPKTASRGIRQTFLTECGWKVVVSTKRKGTYHDIEEALLISLEEVRTRIANNVHLT